MRMLAAQSKWQNNNLLAFKTVYETSFTYHCVSHVGDNRGYGARYDDFHDSSATGDSGSHPR